MQKDMTGMKVLVTAGPTQEALDPVRYITNHSSGKMGYSIAKACMLRGADVTLVTGRTALDAPLLSIPFQLCLPRICTGSHFQKPGYGHYHQGCRRCRLQTMQCL